MLLECEVSHCRGSDASASRRGTSSILSFGWQVAPTIAVGNAVLLKASELTPLTSRAVATLAEPAGLPVGLVNVLAGYGPTTAQAAIANGIVRKVVFVGSPATGAKIAESAARHLIPCILELGGKSANIVFDDSNLDMAALGAQAAVYSGTGHSCTAGSRLLVQRRVYDELIDRVAEGAHRLRIGHPLESSTEIGPISNRGQYEHIKRMIAAGVAEGAQLATGSTDFQTALDTAVGRFARTQTAYPTTLSRMYRPSLRQVQAGRRCSAVRDRNLPNCADADLAEGPLIAAVVAAVASIMRQAVEPGHKQFCTVPE
jgi:delta 1-pyrroline-5-carboxylate dehydrogenase